MQRHLNPKEVAQKCVTAFNLLGAVNGQSWCNYRYDNGTGCAIGISMTPEELDFVKRRGYNVGYSIHRLIEASGLYLVDSPRDLGRLIAIQTAHDTLAGQHRTGTYTWARVRKSVNDQIEAHMSIGAEDDKFPVAADPEYPPRVMDFLISHTRVPVDKDSLRAFYELCADEF